MKKHKKNVHILIAEGDRKLNAILASKIRDLGYEPGNAFSGAEVLERLREQPWDLILLDHKLQDGDVRLLIKQMKQMAGLPPFFILTDPGHVQDAVPLLKDGAFDYWIKGDEFLDAFQEKIRHVAGKVQDLERLDKVKQKIREIEDHSRKVLEAMVDPVSVINREHKIIFSNAAFKNTFDRFTRRTPCYEVIYHRKKPCPWCVSLSGENNKFTRISRLVERDGHFFQALVGPVRLNGWKGYKIAMFRDVSDSVTARRKAEKNETILRNLLGSARDAIIGINEAGRIIMHNRAALELFEEKADALQKQHLFALLSEDKYFMRFKRLFRELVSGSHSPYLRSGFRLSIQTKTGRIKPVEASVSANDINGEKLYMLILRDITEQLKDRRELLEQQLLIRSLIDNLPDHIYYKDTRLRFLLSNKAHDRHVGVTRGEKIIGKTDMDLYPESFAKEYMETERKVIRTGQPLLDVKEKTITREGEIRWQLISKIPVKDGYGKVKGLVGISRDITEIVKKDREIYKSRRRLEGLLEIMLSDKLSKTQILDLALEKAIELTDSEIGFLYFYDEKTGTFTTHSWSETAMDQCKMARRRTVYSLKNVGVWGEAVRQRRPIMINDFKRENGHGKGLPKGHVPIRRFLIIPVFYDNQIVAVTAVANKKLSYNRTDLIQLELLMDTVWKIIVQKNFQKELIRAKEKAEESERLKTIFMSTMSHELRTPLNAILGFSRILEQMNVPEEVGKYAGYITESGERLLSIIENIFYVSAIDGKHLHISEEEILLVSFIKEIYEGFRQKSIPDNISFKTDLPEEDISIKTDPKITEQILNALLDNAFKFTPSGEVTLGVRALENAIQYFVKDTGIGIPEDKREEVFERFRQLDDSTTREYGGTGIGLYLVKRLAEVLGGKVWIEDNQPSGTVFYVEIPVTVLSRTTGNVQQGRDAGKEKGESTKTVLIAEDNPVSALLLKKIVENAGLKTVHVENGLEAVEHVRKGNPCDLVLMDLNMPVMDGFEAIKKIKKIKDELPIIIQTAYDSETGREKANQLKVADFIRKPFTREQVIEKINRHIREPGITGE